MTAIEWLEKRFYFTKGQLIDIDFEQAKTMEKEQIIEASAIAYKDMFGSDGTEYGQEHYNKTFKSE